MEDRPRIQIEQPPREWIERLRREEEENSQNSEHRGVITIDIGGNEKSSDDRDENGIITIQM